MRLIQISICCLLSLAPLFAKAQRLNDKHVVSNITEHVLINGKAYQDLHYLCKKIGHRLSGSEQEQRTVAWLQSVLMEAGADTVWLQAVKVPKWVRGAESFSVSNGSRHIDIPMLSLGNSEGTGGKKLSGNIVLFESIEDLKNVDTATLKGKIAFLNVPFPEHFPCTFDGYSEVGSNRFSGPAIAAEKGASAFVIRSLSTGVGSYDLPHTGVTSYGNAKRKIPAIAISNKAADSLSAWIKSGKTLTGTLRSHCGMQDSVLSYNVIGEIKGQSNKIITVGAHHDSWDVGEGAHDDGAGCVQSIEVLRTFKQLGMRPRNTIRVVLFANEENGVAGGKVYADYALQHGEQHLFALESDAGGFSPRGFSMSMDEQLKDLVRSWSDILFDLGVYDFSKPGGGVDINPLHKKLQTPVAGLLPDTQRYFDIHHCAQDTYETVNRRELLMGAAAMTALVYLVDKYF